MAKGFAIHQAPTDHGGQIASTQMSISQQGHLFVRAGDGHVCPRCHCWSTVVKSHDHIILEGKPVAYVGDQLTCGARILPQQSHVVGESGVYDQSDQGGNELADVPIYGHRFQLKDELTNEPLSNICYEIIKNNKSFHGTTDKNGYTELITSDQAEEIRVNIIYEEHQHER